LVLQASTALVTGATKGIGLETCKVLADAGADIAAVGRDTAGLKEAEDAVKAAGRQLRHDCRRHGQCVRTR
jgi:NAD(P)-dependent dehydrogenase (short-subunit alcohol dehydrogenase family)